MAINNMTKMKNTNVKVRRWLKENGYCNLYAFPHSRFSKDYHINYKNITADFDGIATKDNNIVFYQSKSNCKAPKKTLKDYKALESIFGIKCLWFNAQDRKKLAVNNVQF